MKEFIREDGKKLRVIEGFRDQFVRLKPGINPKAAWRPEDYEKAANTKIKRANKHFKLISEFGGSLNGKRILEIGCGGGIDCILIALQPVREVVGIDLRLRLFAQGEEGERFKRLAQVVLKQQATLGDDLEKTLSQLPLRFECMDSRELPFPDNYFDCLVSRSVLEHVKSIEKALLEMARVVRPGGLMVHNIDPYFWYRGCHRPGLVDIPWAHARLSAKDYRRFVTEHEGGKVGEKRCARLDELNHFTLEKWRNVIESGPFEIVKWKELHNETCEEILAMYPDITETIMDGVGRRDLTFGRIRTLLRNKK